VIGYCYALSAVGCDCYALSAVGCDYFKVTDLLNQLEAQLFNVQECLKSPAPPLDLLSANV